MQYSETLKARMVQKLADPRGPSATQLAEQVGIPQSTLSRWLRRGGTFGGNGRISTDHVRRATMAKRPQDWTAEEKLQAVIEAGSVSEEELGAFLRRQGLHEAQLRAWRQQVLQGLEKAPARGSKKRTPEGRRVRQLERELDRKDKALAEAAALLVLKKKAQAIWGDEDDDTTKKSASRS